MRRRLSFLMFALCIVLAGCGKSETPEPAANTKKDGEKGAWKLPAEFLQLELPPLQDVPLPKDEPRKRSWPAEPLKPVATKDLPIKSSASGAVTPEAGGTVSLKNGAQVRIPAGSVTQPVTVQLLEIKPSGSDEGTCTLFRLEPDGLRFNTPATLVLPFEAAKTAKDSKDAPPVTVSVLDPTKGWEPLPAQVNAADGTVTAQINHFSDYKTSNGSWGIEFSLERPPVKLAGPYYSQGNSSWCTLASDQMLLKFYGRDIEIWELAHIYGANPNIGVSMAYYSTVYQSLGFEINVTYGGWDEPKDMTGFIQSMLATNRPVRVGIQRINHDFLVVGFDKEGIWINDPSGACLEDLRGGASLDENNLGPVRLTWQEWFGKTNWINGKPIRSGPGGLLGTNSGGKYTHVVKKGDPSPIPAVTMTLLSWDLQFKIPRPANFPRDLFNRFTWDGTKPGGYEFGGAIPPVLIGLPKADPTNSDTLHQFTVTLSNSTAQDVKNAVVELYLDGKLLRSKKGIELPAGITNEKIDVMENAPYDFTSQPLALGSHNLQVLLKVGSETTDKVSVRFSQGPSRPAGLTAIRSGDKVKLAWNPNPEEAKGLGDVAYVVWRDGKEPRIVFENSFEDALPTKDAAGHEYRVEALYAGANPNDPLSYLSSYVSDPAMTAPLETKLLLLGMLESNLGDKGTRVIPDRNADRKVWSDWRDAPIGSIIKIDNEEMELTGGGDVARYVDRGVNGTTVQPHAKGAKIYLVRRGAAK